MKRTAVAGACAALALTGVVTPPASAGKPVPVPPTATIVTASVGAAWDDPLTTAEEWVCDVTVTATVTGVSSNRYYARFMANIDGFSSGWQELTWTPIRLTRGQTEVIYTAHPGGTAAQIPDYKAFRLDLVTRPHGRNQTWDVITSSPEITVSWNATTCAP